MMVTSQRQRVLAIRKRIFEAIRKERTRQDKLWGDEFDSKNTINDWVTYINIYLSKAAQMDRSAVVSKGKFVLDTEAVRENVLKAITIGVAFLERLDGGNVALRHYDASLDELARHADNLTPSYRPSAHHQSG